MMKSFLLSIIFLTSLSAQTTYYFSSSGNDSNNGQSSDSPKKTLSALQNLLNNSSPGDKFLLKRGDIWTTRAGTHGLSITTCKGTPSNYIVIGSYGTGNKPKFDFSGTNHAIVISGGSVSARPYYIKIQGLHITSSNSTSFPDNGIYIGTSNDTSTSPRDIIIDDVTIDNLRDGVRGQSPLVNITVQNCLIQDMTVTGIFLGSINSIIRNNVIVGVGGGNDYTKGIYMSDAINGLIEGNDISNNFGLGASGGILIANGYNITIRGNVVHNNSYEGIQIGDRNSNMFTCDSVVIEKNVIHSSIRLIEIHPTSTNAGNGTSRIYIRNNIFYNASYYGIYNSLSDFSDSYIVNNTFYNCLDAVKLGGGITNLTVKNNIFYNDAYPTGNLINFVNGTTGLNNTNLDYNLYYASVGNDTKVSSTTRILAQFQAAYPMQEQNGILANPLINLGVFNIGENSPAINAGADLSSFGVLDDFDGNPRPVGNGFDIGAFEYGSAGGSNTINVNINILLEGSFNNGNMVTALLDNGHIPLNQPYNQAPWNYNGNESVSSIPLGVVDWVLLELRTGASSSTIAARKAAFLKSDGSIVDLDGISSVSLNDISDGNYYIVVRHRNHLDIMSSNTVALSSDSPLYDFSTGSDKAYGTNAQTDLGSGKWGMFAGDGDLNGLVNVIDFGSVSNYLFQTGYRFGDLDLNGVINIMDYAKTNLNLFRNSQVPN